MLSVLAMADCVNGIHPRIATTMNWIDFRVSFPRGRKEFDFSDFEFTVICLMLYSNASDKNKTASLRTALLLILFDILDWHDKLRFVELAV